MQESSDLEIIKQVLTGEREQYRYLIDRYKNQVYSMIMRQLGDADKAEELCHEVFIKAYKNLASFRAEAKFSSWLVKIALNHTNTYFKSKSYRQVQLTEDLQDHRLSAESKSPEAILEQRELLVSFRNCIAKLKPLFRDALTLCALENKSYEEVANIFHIPVGTVRSRLNKARLLLRECMHAGGAYG